MTVSKTTAMLTAKKVAKSGDMYAVFEAKDVHGDIHWHQVSKEYAHSTSAFAALGRLYQKELSGK